MIQKNRMIQVVSREQALIKQKETNSKPPKLLFKTYTPGFEFDRHLKHIVSYQQNGLPVFLIGEFGTFEIFMQNDCLEKPDISYLFNYKHQK